jgi:hypothetical protein
LVINTQTTKLQGLTVPPTLLATADRRKRVSDNQRGPRAKPPDNLGPAASETRAQCNQLHLNSGLGGDADWAGLPI